MRAFVSSAAEIAHAAEILLQGGLVAFPTETVYGLGADAESPEAVGRIYAAKGRPSNHPVIVHVTPEADLSYWVKTVPPEAQALIDAFWPGPLTLILKRADSISSVVSGGQDSIGIRCPSHPVAQALIRSFVAGRKTGHGGIAAPSANKFGQVSPTQAMHVRDEFPELLSQGMPILEGGASEVGIESTIVDLSRIEQGLGAVLLRPGHITASQIAEVLNRPVQAADAHAPRVSGALKSHYAPHTLLQLANLDTLQKLAVDPAQPKHQRLALVSYSRVHPPIGISAQVDWITMPHGYAAYGQVLYATLRALDQAGYARMIWEEVPEHADWSGVRDRLSRAAAAF
jgi:L-threonylcarbamoyladenylate synthase